MIRTLLSSWSKLVSGNVLNALLQLAVFTIAARSLDLKLLGVLILIQTYARVADGLLNFQSVNVLTRYLAEAEAAEDHTWFRGLLKAGLLVDGGTALLATLVGIAALPLLAPVIGLNHDWLGPAMLFCLVIATRVFGAVEAALRCFDRFWVIGFRPAVVSALALAASLVAWAMGAGAMTFLQIWLWTEVIGNIAFLAWAIGLLRQHGVSGLWQSSAREAIGKSPRFWPMMWQTNATFAVRILSQDGDVLVAGAVLGPAAAGLLRAAKNLANMLGQLGRPLQQVASVPISRLAASGRLREAQSYALRIAVIACVAGLAAAAAMLLLAGPVLRIAFGEAFVAAKWITVLLFVGRALYLSGVTLLPAMLVFDLGNRFLGAVIFGTAAYTLALVTLVGPLGLIGIGIAHLAFEVVWSLTGWISIARQVGRRGGAEALGPA